MGSKDDSISHWPVRIQLAVERVSFKDADSEPCVLINSDPEAVFGIWLGDFDRPMHLDRDRVKELHRLLSNWIESGSFEDATAKGIDSTCTVVYKNADGKARNHRFGCVLSESYYDLWDHAERSLPGCQIVSLRVDRVVPVVPSGEAGE